jgi:hypothetical protein
VQKEHKDKMQLSARRKRRGKRKEPKESIGQRGKYR